MVNAVNRLIEELASDKFDESTGLEFLDDKRKKKLNLLVVNLKRIRGRLDLELLPINLLTDYVNSLQKYYEKKISFRDYLKASNNADAKEINKKIDQVIEQLNRVSTAVYVEPMVKELIKSGVNDSIIKEAIEIPDMTGGMNKIRSHVINSVAVFGHSPLNKEQIFNLVLLRIAASAHSENIPVPEVNKIRRHFDSEDEPSSYSHTQKLTRLIKEFTIRLNCVYPNYKKLFLARDGIILYEAQITLHRTSCDLIYVSRDTIKDYFSLFSGDLDLVISKVGLNHAEALIEGLYERFLSYYKSNDSYKRIFDSIITYLKPFIDNNTVFVDSSSKSLPIILCAIAKIFYPSYDFKAYFYCTIYEDPKVGFILGRKDFIVDMLPDYVEYDASNSSIFPWYIQKFIPIANKRMKQQQAYMAHLVLQSELHSSII